MPRWWLVVTVFWACGDDGGGTKPPDAAMRDAAMADTDAPAFNCMTSPTAGTHKLFLQFEGVMLTKGTTSAPLNQISFFNDTVMSATIPVWKAAVADRADQIASIVCNVREVLFPFDVEVVTTRPASGDYDMVVFGGEPGDLGFQTGTGTAYAAVSGIDCPNANRTDVAVIFERAINGGFNTTSALDSSIFAGAFVGSVNGLSPSKQPTNCLCNVSSSEAVSCNYMQMCSYSTAAPVAQGGCSTQMTENQIAKLVTAYGARM